MNGSTVSRLMVVSSGQEDNLYSATKRLRQDDKDIIVWVDAICVNQDDDHEKGRRVKRMVQLYQQDYIAVVEPLLLLWRR